MITGNTKEENKKIKTFVKRISFNPKKSREEIKMKFKKIPPHSSLHNFQTIKWLRSRLDQPLFKRMINTLLPGNGVPVEDENRVKTRGELANEFLTTYCRSEDKFKNIEIAPKYFYSTLVLTKIQKLLDIFLEFDGDGSRKLEIGEMVTMFNTNNIPVIEKELVGLFFKDKKLKIGEEPYLDFYQFMSFALSKESDQDFRSFMRILKKKKRQVEINDDNIDPDKENLFLPMNFNLVLDYFNNKGKQRESEEKIRAAIERMNKIINVNSNKIGENESNIIKVTKRKIDDSFSDASQNSVTEDNEKPSEKKIQKEEYDAVNAFSILEEFQKLFQQKHASEISNNTNKITKKFTKSNTLENSERILINKSKSENKPFVQDAGNVQNLLYKYNATSSINSKNLNSDRVLSETSITDSNKYTNYLKHKVNSDDAEKITLKLYDKYKCVNRVAEEIKNMNKMVKSSRNSSTFSNIPSTADNTLLSSNRKLSDKIKNKFEFKSISKFSSHINKIATERTVISQFSIHSNNVNPPLLPEIGGLSKKVKNSNPDHIPVNLLMDLNPRINYINKIF